MTDPFTRVVSFDRVGVHRHVEPLTVTATTEAGFKAAISVYAERHLDATATVRVDAHPDSPEGNLRAGVINDQGRTEKGPFLGRFTVSLPGADEVLEHLEAQIASLQSLRSEHLLETTGVPF